MIFLHFNGDLLSFIKGDIIVYHVHPVGTSVISSKTMISVISEIGFSMGV